MEAMAEAFAERVAIILEGNVRVTVSENQAREWAWNGIVKIGTW
jgi:hypothetical protein